jgi:transcriptional regulator with XRE-family HTH domain
LSIPIGLGNGPKGLIFLDQKGDCQKETERYYKGMKINERIRTLRKTKMTQADMATAVGVSLKTIGRWESGERLPDAEELTKIASVLETTVAYLIGESVPSGRSYDEPSNVKGPFLEVIELPILSAEITACCGDGTPIIELTSKAEKTVLFPRSKIGRIDDLRPPFAINSEGDSMEGFGVQAGALVAVNPAEEVRSGNVALVCIGDRVALKKVYVKPTGFELVSSDGRPATTVSQEDVECGWFKILGRGQGAIVDLDQEP